MLSVSGLKVIRQSVVDSQYDGLSIIIQSQYAGCNIFIVMLSGTVLNVAKLIAIVLGVIVPGVKYLLPCYFNAECL